jgi:hypothetical protein
VNHGPASSTSNPFSTCFVRPGQIPFLFQGAESATTLVERLSAERWQGQIIGPHGTGKSTLVAMLATACETAGRRPWLARLRDGQRRLSGNWASAVEQCGASLVIIDGYEQLPRWRRWWTRRCCRRRGWRLLVTAHADVGLPTLYRTDSSIEMAQAIVGHLLAHRATQLDDRTVAEVFLSSGGNLREVLFALYDRYEHGNATVLRRTSGSP